MESSGAAGGLFAPGEEADERVRKLRQDAALALHEYRKALMPLVGASEYSASKCEELFRRLEAFAAELPPAERARLLEIIAKPKEQLGQLLESSVRKHRFLIVSLEQLIRAAMPESAPEPEDQPPTA